MTAPPASTSPSTFAPSSLVGGVTLKAMMAQFVHMDAHLDTLSDELCQVNTRVGRITVETEAALDTDDSSSGVYLSIHLYSFVFSGWSDT